MRSLNSKLQRWQDNALITPEQAESIKTFESKHSQNWFWSSIGLVALLAVLLGIGLIVAANWQAIPAFVKMSVHFAVNAGLAYAFFKHPNWKWRDGVVLALFGLTLSFMALVSQTFQLQGESIDLIRLWFWVCAPFLFLHLRAARLREVFALATLVMLQMEIGNAVKDLPEKYVTPVGMILAYGVLLTAAHAHRLPAAFACFTRASILASLFLLGTSSLVTGMLFTQPALSPEILAACVLVSAAAFYVLWVKETFATVVVAASILASCCFTMAPANYVLNIALYGASWFGLSYIGYRYNALSLARLGIILIVVRLLYEFGSAFEGLLFSGLGFIFTGVVLYGIFVGGKKLDAALLKRWTTPNTPTLPTGEA